MKMHHLDGFNYSAMLVDLKGLCVGEPAHIAPVTSHCNFYPILMQRYLQLVYCSVIGFTPRVSFWDGRYAYARPATILRAMNDDITESIVLLRLS